VAKGPSWAPSSGVGFIPGDSRPTPGDMVRMAEEQALLDRLAENHQTTIQLPKSEIENTIKIPGKKITFSTKP
jgi:hypothetical protein